MRIVLHNGALDLSYSLFCLTVTYNVSCLFNLNGSFSNNLHLFCYLFNTWTSIEKVWHLLSIFIWLIGCNIYWKFVLFLTKITLWKFTCIILSRNFILKGMIYLKSSNYLPAYYSHITIHYHQLTPFFPNIKWFINKCFFILEKNYSESIFSPP